VTRRTVLAKIRKALEPRLYESGYQTGPVGSSRPYRVAPLAKPRQLAGFAVEEIEGFAEDGVVEEFSIACVTIYWRAVPLEDLTKILALVTDPKTRWRTRAA